MDNPTLQIILTIATPVVSLLLGFLGGKYQAGIEIQKNKQNKLQELQIEYFQELWKKIISLRESLSDLFFQTYTFLANLENLEDRKLTEGELLEFSQIFDKHLGLIKSTSSFFYSINILLPDDINRKAEKVLDLSFSSLENFYSSTVSDELTLTELILQLDKAEDVYRSELNLETRIFSNSLQDYLFKEECIWKRFFKSFKRFFCINK